MAINQLQFQLFCSAELEAFVDSAGSIANQRRKEYLKLLQYAFESILATVCIETDSMKVDSFTYYLWTTKGKDLTSDMMFHFIDREWEMSSMLICFFNSCNMSKTADAHEQLIATVVKRIEKIGENVLIYFATSHNEVAVALGVDQILSYVVPCGLFATHTLSPFTKHVI